MTFGPDKPTESILSLGTLEMTAGPPNPTFAVRWVFGSESLGLCSFLQKVYTTGFGFLISGGG